MTDLRRLEPAEAAAWLRGFCDAEGHVRKAGAAITLYNTDATGIAYASRCLWLLGIAHRICERPPRDAHRVTLYQINIQRQQHVAAFIGAVGATAPHKRMAMAAVLWRYRSTPAVRLAWVTAYRNRARTVDARAWLRGVFDGDGCVVTQPTGGWIDFTNTDPVLIAAIERSLAGLGIASTTHRQDRSALGHRAIWHVHVRRRGDSLRFIRSVGAILPKHRARLVTLLRWYRRETHRDNFRWEDHAPPTREVLARCVEARLSPTEIAQQLGLTLNTAQHYLGVYGLTGRHYQPWTFKTDPAEVRRLYEEERLSCAVLAARYGCARATMQRFMERHGIARRDKREPLAANRALRWTKYRRVPPDPSVP